MIVTGFLWIWVGISAFLWGFPLITFFNQNLNKKTKEYIYPSLIILVGLMALTVYAEIFSLFYRVNIEANVGVFAINLIIFVLMRKEITQNGKTWVRELWPWKLIIIAFLGVIVLLCSAMEIKNGDTYLYHAQAIHWISDYGVVKGLGNLHTRFAFNSAFLCLQALFSVPFATGGVSLHSVNGFVAWLFLSYAICNMKLFRQKKVFVSDFARIALIVYIVSMVDNYSSPGTDIFALGLSSFIVCEWISFAEEGNKNPSIYAFLSLFIVFCITLKLSTAMMILLCIYPACLLIKQKKEKEIIIHLLLGLVIILPFFARNFYISGWLVYPFNKIDLFKVDWKIPAETLTAECSRTLAGSREIYMVPEITLNDPFTVWFPRWLSVNGTGALILVITSIVSGVILTAIGLIKTVRNKSIWLLHISLVLLVCIAYWYVSAPMIRYGKPYLLLLPLILTGVIIKKVAISQRANRILRGFFLAGFLCCFLPVILYARYERRILNWPYDYYRQSCTAYEVDGNKLYVPDVYGSIGYYSFPAVQYESTLDNFELREDTFSDGFRAKEDVVYLF